MPPEALAITAAAGITAVGDSLAQSCASIRVKVPGFGDHPDMVALTPNPPWGERVPLRVAFAPDLAAGVDGRERIERLALRALQGLVDDACFTRKRLRRAGIFLALPEAESAPYDAASLDAFGAIFCDRAGLPGVAAVRSTSLGHAAVFKVLDDVARAIEAGTIDEAIVLGVDSYLPRERLAQFDRAYRIKTRRGVDGFVPGEAAFALLVEAAPRVSARGVPSLAVIEALGFGLEAETVASDKASSGRGLSDALAAVVPEGGAPYVLCDLNGESYRSFEWGVAGARLGHRMGRVAKLVHPADCTGDVGAASGALLIGAAIESFRRGYAPAPVAVAWTSADRGARAAARIVAPDSSSKGVPWLPASP